MALKACPSPGVTCRAARILIIRAMPTYEYETIPQQPRQRATRFELYQPITSKALTRHPETGEPVRRVISGGLGIFTESKASEGPSPCGAGGCDVAQSCEAAQAGACGGGMCGL